MEPRHHPDLLNVDCVRMCYAAAFHFAIHMMKKYNHLLISADCVVVLGHNTVNNCGVLYMSPYISILEQCLYCAWPRHCPLLKIYGCYMTRLQGHSYPPLHHI